MSEAGFDFTLKRFEVMEKAKQDRLIKMKTQNAVKRVNEQRPSVSPKAGSRRAPLAERTQQILEEKEQRVAQKKKNMQIEKWGKELDECTFKPTINNYSTASKKQNSENQHPRLSRVDSMLKWADEKNKKLANIALQHDPNISHMPLLHGANGSGIKKKMNSQAIEKSTERLYRQHQQIEKKKMDLQVRESELLKFKPEINKKSIQLLEKRRAEMLSQQEAHITEEDQDEDEQYFKDDIHIENLSEEPADPITKRLARKVVTPKPAPSKPQQQPRALIEHVTLQVEQPKVASKRKNIFEDDPQDYVELEKTIGKAQMLFNMDKRKCKELPKPKQATDNTNDVASRLRDLCTDIDNLA